jgi:hypothetical protein
VNGGRNYRLDRCSYVIKIRLYAGKPEGSHATSAVRMFVLVTMRWVQVISREGQTKRLEPSETVRRTPAISGMIQSDLRGDMQSGYQSRRPVMGRNKMNGPKVDSLPPVLVTARCASGYMLGNLEDPTLPMLSERSCIR